MYFQKNLCHLLYSYGVCVSFNIVIRLKLQAHLTLGFPSCKYIENTFVIQRSCYDCRHKISNFQETI